MTRVSLAGGSYEARSLIAGAQTCINLLQEVIPQAEGEPSGMAHYPTPGLALRATFGSGGWRALYRASNGVLYGVNGQQVVRIDSGYAFTLLGTMVSATGPVSLSDNTVNVLIVDGTAAGYSLTMASNAFATISSPAFYGGNKVDLIDGFFVLNRPGTNQFYLSNNIDITFDPLYIAAKSHLDRIVSLIVVRSELWVYGERTTEIYQDVGASDFPLQRAALIEYGCAATASVAKGDGKTFWLSRSAEGKCIAVVGEAYQAKRISTHAIERVFQDSYAVISDAIGYIYQLGGHMIYVLTFPTAGATWAYDLASGLWHQWQYGLGERHRGSCYVNWSGLPLIGDYATGSLYQLDLNSYTDAGNPIRRQRAFPHMTHGGDRVFYQCLVIDMQTGVAAVGSTDTLLTLEWSDDRGATYVGTQTTDLGVANRTGKLLSLQFQRLGMARDRVFRLTWTMPAGTALLGAWVDVKNSSS